MGLATPFPKRLREEASVGGAGKGAEPPERPARGRDLSRLSRRQVLPGLSGAEATKGTITVKGDARVLPSYQRDGDGCSGGDELSGVFGLFSRHRHGRAFCGRRRTVIFIS
ncbi:MAG: hypothetical protein HPY61_12560 [Methanotrichaceae archaeon]|nr:hypothetical protein [Methanotrichaceae archaeon]